MQLNIEMNIASNELIPELRFPQFVNTRGWVKENLIGTADKKIKWSFTGGPFGSNLQASDYTSGGIRIIQLQNIGNGEFIDNYKIYTSKEKADELESCNIYAGDIILSKMGDPVGRACIIPDFLERCVMASDGIRLVVDETKYSKYFIFSLLNSEQIREAIEKKATGSTRKRIGLDDLREIELVVPKSLSEQQKIASCLSSLDEIIATHTQKLDILKEHKRGLMQDLFPQEGETGPKRRFPEFSKSGKWSNEKLDNLTTKVGSGVTPLGGETKYKKNGRPFVRSQNVGWGILLLKDIAFIDDKTHLESIGTEIELDDVLLNITGASIGRSAVASEQVVGGNVNQHVCIIRTIKGSLNSNFLCQYLISSLGQKQIDSYQAGGNRQGLNFVQIRSLTLPIPPSLDEQRKISECLSSLNDKISAQNLRVQQLKLHKSGLLQGLFPKIKR